MRQNIFSDPPLKCPLCQQPLVTIALEKTCRCSLGHSFDIARQGYVNLLPVNAKSSKTPGDSKDMVLARRAFLSRDFYKTVSDALNSLVLQHLTKMPTAVQPLRILDLGCGEGYYSVRLLDALDDQKQVTEIYGIDISKEAVRHAAASHKDMFWMVGSNFHVPLQNATLDCIFSVFSPVESKECARLLKPAGRFFRVLPGVNHLIELRKLIYDEVVLNEESDYALSEEDLVYEAITPVTYRLCLDQEQLQALVKMTPHYWHTSKSDKAVLETLETLEITVDMQIYSYYRT